MPSAEQRLEVALRFFTPAMRGEYDVLVAALTPAPVPPRCKFASTCEFSHHPDDSTNHTNGDTW